MKKENKNNYYNEEDKINFEKLNNFKKFKSDNVKNIQIKNYSNSYSNSDKNNFNNILKNNENIPVLNQKDINKEVEYYNPSDFKKFDQLNNFPEYDDNKTYEDKENINSKLTYKSSDYGEFNKIIQTKNGDEKIKEKNKKIKVVDYSKLKDVGKKLKNKIGIEKIKIVYFD